MYLRRFSVLFFVGFCIVTGSAFAESSKDIPPLDTLLDLSLEELNLIEVSAATGTPKPLKLAPAVATVITAADIEMMGATNLEQILQTVPGLYVSEYFIQEAPIYSMRGVHSLLNTHMLLQVNGLPLKRIFSGGVPRTLNIPVDIISRVEVIRGPGYAVHGADALAGTINVITKESFEVDSTETSLLYGSFDTFEATVMHGDTYRG